MNRNDLIYYVFLFRKFLGKMHLDLVPPQVTQIPPWKLELLSRRSALSRTVEPKLNGVCLDPVPDHCRILVDLSGLFYNIMP